MPEFIDVAIPRGGESLIRRVAAEAKMPVIKHFTGNCHVYVDASADLDMAERITINAKCQRMGVCNACESLLVHADVADTFLPRIGTALAERGIEIRGRSSAAASCCTGSEAGDRRRLCHRISGTDYLGQGRRFARTKPSTTSTATARSIPTRSSRAIWRPLAQFTARVDSSAVMVNASTRFNDGYQFGLGAEIGISTDKFHARGPCGLEGTDDV